MNKAKPKILILSWEILPLMTGGLGVLVRSLVDELTNQGAEVITLVPHELPEDEDTTGIVSVAKGVKQHFRKKPIIAGIEDFTFGEFVLNVKKQYSKWPQLYSAFRGKKNQQNLYPQNTPVITRAYALAVADWLEKNNPDSFDVIYGMDWMAIPAMYELKNRGITVPFYFHINSSQVDRSGGESMSDPTAKAIFGLEYKGFREADKIAVVSDVSRDVLIDKYDIEPDKIFTVFNDITFVPETKGYDDLDTGKNILFIGRVVPQKGLFFLIDTAARVAQIDPQVRFIIAGDGTPDGNILPEIIEEVARKGLERQVIFTGWVNGDAKKQLYKTCQLFVMPSPSEPFGLTALEAIRSGVPALASDTSGFIGVVPSTPTFAYHDTDAFANTILHFLHDPAARAALLKRQTDDLVDHSWSREVAKIIDII